MHVLSPRVPYKFVPTPFETSELEVLRKERNEHVVVFWDTHSDVPCQQFLFGLFQDACRHQLARLSAMQG